MKAQKKPITVEAELFDGSKESADRLVEMYEDVHFHLERKAGEPFAEWTGLLQIDTLEGVMIASPGDWIITGVKGERYACKPDIFEQTYTLV